MWARLAVAVLLFLVGCESFIDADFDVTRVSCKHRAPIGRPPPGNYGDNSATQIVAVRAFDFGDANGRGTKLGFDLDGVCTNRSQGPSCRRNAWTGAADVTDGEDGIDNAGAVVLGGQSGVFGAALVTSAQLTADVESGSAPPMVVFRISQFNGSYRDAQLKVEWFLPALIPAGTGGTARWNAGTLDVPVDTRTGDGAVSVLVDDQAYADQGVVVAHFAASPGTPLLFRLGRTVIDLQNAILSLDVPNAGNPFAHGILAGTIKSNELLRQVGAFTGADGDLSVICTDNVVYPRIKSYFCGVADMASRPERDAPCDLVSFGADISLSPVVLGKAVPPEVTTRCAPELDPGADDCAAPAIVRPVVDAGTSPVSTNCVAEGTPNNSRGLGAPCRTSADCPGAFCSAEFGAPDNARFCTTLCLDSSTCGEGVQCASNGALRGCVPDACVPRDGG